MTEHRIYDADTGVCIDCEQIIDPLAPLVTATLSRTTETFMLAYTWAIDEWNYSDRDAIEYALPHALRSAFALLNDESPKSQVT